MTHKEILTVLVRDYSEAVKATENMDREQYFNYLHPRKMGLGAFYYLGYYLGGMYRDNDTHHKAYTSYWMRRNLKGSMYLCPNSYQDRKYLIYRLKVFQRELNKINKYGWFARLF